MPKCPICNTELYPVFKNRSECESGENFAYKCVNDSCPGNFFKSGEIEAREALSPPCKVPRCGDCKEVCLIG